MNLAVLLQQAATAFPERPAVSVGDNLLRTYRELARNSASVAAALRQRLGVLPGDRVALVMSNCPEYLEVLFGVWWAGCVAVPVNARLHPREIGWIVGNSGARVCLLTEDKAESSIPDLPPGVDPLVLPGVGSRALYGEPGPLKDVPSDAPAWLFYTSGTTGRPKGAMLSHRNLMTMAMSYLCDVDPLGPEDALLHIAAQSHASGLFALSHIAKASHQVLPASGGFEEAEIADLITRYKNLTLFVPPTLLRRLCRASVIRQAPLERVRSVLCGAAPVHAGDLREAVAVFGPRIWNGYGQGESPCTISAMSKAQIADAVAAGDDERLVSVGIARTGVEVAVMSPEDSPLAPGEVGEIVVRGDTVMAGYWDNPEATAEALRGGWLHTGDLGRFDDQGYLTLLDRSKDLIISGGMNIYPREIEELLMRHPSVQEAAIVAAPDPEWGERPVAFIVPTPGQAADQAELDAYCLQYIARFKRPRAYRVVDDMPKNSIGKILKTELRKRLSEE